MTDNRTLPWSWYTDPRVLERERLTVFRNSWHYVGHVGMLPAAPSYFPADLGGIPIVVTRTAADTFHALSNVCRHRGAIVCDEQGEGQALRCPYHAWTYELEGSLRSAPRADREIAFDPKAHGLTSAGLDRWGPFLFANASTDPVPFPEWMGDVPQRVAEVMDVDSLRFLRRWEGRYAANWKVCIENFLECYHCRLAHPGFSKVIDTGPDDYRLIAADHGSSQYGPVREAWTGPFDPRGPVGRGQFHVLHPNTAINVMPGQPNLSIGPIVPITPGESHRYLDYFFGADVDKAWISEMLAFDDQVGLEDRPLVESVQLGMAAGAHSHGTLFLDSEQLIAHFAEYIRSRIE